MTVAPAEGGSPIAVRRPPAHHRGPFALRYLPRSHGDLYKWVTDGARTRDLRDHNPMLCQLSYDHQATQRFYQPAPLLQNLTLTFARKRLPGVRLDLQRRTR